LGKEWTAAIGSGRNPGRAFRTMKAGETIDGWTIAKIEDKSVLVQSGERQEVLIMNDPTAALQRVAEKTAASAASPVTQVSSPPRTTEPAGGPATAASPPPAAATPGNVIVTPFGNIVVGK
jgi:hypothetical protein